jgi:hypothetical protein
MTQYFQATIVNPNYKLNLDFQTATAVYCGPNQPKAPAGAGTPIVWTPPAENSGTVGTATIQAFVPSTVPNQPPTLSSITVEMSQENALSLGSVLASSFFSSSACHVAICSGGIFAASLKGQWQGCETLYSKAPNSENLGNAWVNTINYFASQGINSPNAGWDSMPSVILGAAIGVGLAVGGVGAVTLGLAALGGILLFPNPAEGDTISSGYVDNLGNAYSGWSDMNDQWGINLEFITGGGGGGDFTIDPIDFGF